MRELIAVAAGGVVGAVSRYLLSGWVHRLAGAGFPWGTLAVNVAGCFAIGGLMAAVNGPVVVSPQLRLFLGIGLLGSLTTFSTFGYETLALIDSGELRLALVNAGGNLLLGLAAVALGQAALRWWLG